MGALREVRERGRDTAHRHLPERAAGVHALAEPRDLEQPLDLGDRAVVPDVRDEQARRIRADVGRGDAHRGIVAGLASKGVLRYHPGDDAGWSSPVARRAHNPKVAGSNPAPAIHGGRARRGALRRVLAAVTPFRSGRVAVATACRSRRPRRAAARRVPAVPRAARPSDIRRDRRSGRPPVYMNPGAGIVLA